jgi:FAD/FMN-containing dehydrogenase
MELRDGRAFTRGDAGYEAARRATVWNARIPDRIPDRFPDVIVQAGSAADVVAAVRSATADGLRIGIASGGHSWVAARLPDLHVEFGST